MPRSLRAAGCVRNTLSQSATPHSLWISDDLLADVFHNFTRNQRRYGSNVPGPLEARRRAAKRKNTSLAHHNLQASPLNPAIIFGSQPSDQWWQTPPAPKVERASRFLPSWLHQSPEPMYSSRPPELSSAHSEEEARRKLQRGYVEELQECLNLKSIRLLVESLQLKLRFEPEIAESAFRRVLELHWAKTSPSNGALSDFLSDPELNPSGSHNHIKFLQEVGKRQVTSEIWETLVLPIIHNAFKLGLVCTTDLQQIFLDLPAVLRGAGLGSRLENDLPIRDWHYLLKGVQSCQILSMKDLGQEFKATWLQIISEIAPSQAVTQLIWEIGRYANHCDPEVFLSYLLPRMRQQNTNTETILKDMAHAVDILPAEERGLTLLRASQTLVASSLAGHVSKAELDLWHRFMTELNSISTSSTRFDKESWRRACNNGAMLTPAQNLMTSVWTMSSVWSRQSIDYHDLDDHGIVRQFSHIFQTSSQGTTHDVLSQMVMTLDTLPLPRKDLLYQQLSGLLNANVASLYELQNYEESIQKFANRDFRIFDDERFHHWAMQNSRDELTLVAESANNNLAALSQMCQVIIMKDKTRLKIVRRILEHNASMKLAVSFWPEQTSVLKGLGHHFAGFRPNDVVAFVHSLALSAAVSPVLEPRSALRNVQYFYGWLRRYGAPILPSMSRALWHAGVTRYGKGGCPSTQLRWCLTKVEEIEGSEVKRMLLWSAERRRHWAAEMDGYRSMVDHSNAQQSKLFRKVETKNSVGNVSVGKHWTQAASKVRRRVSRDGNAKRA